ncbi:hypothetical protein GCM10009756_19420 [Pseudokineococcus marinus]
MVLPAVVPPAGVVLLVLVMDLSCASPRRRPGAAGARTRTARAGSGRPERPSSTARAVARADGWQVFGLPGADLSVLLLAVASQAGAQCSMTAVVPGHRCGAVPVSHRVPSLVLRRGRRRNQSRRGR